jgi:hypothetical protein
VDDVIAWNKKLLSISSPSPSLLGEISKKGAQKPK